MKYSLILLTFAGYTHAMQPAPNPPKQPSKTPYHASQTFPNATALEAALNKLGQERPSAIQESDNRLVGNGPLITISNGRIDTIDSAAAANPVGAAIIEAFRASQAKRKNPKE